MRSGGLILLVVVGLAGCQELDPDYGAVSYTDSEFKLIANSAEVMRLLAEASAHDEKVLRVRRELPRDQGLRLTEDMLMRPESYLVERRKLLADMARQPGVLVTGKQYFRILQQSTARCAPYPTDTAEYLKVRVTTGPARGAEGWACSRDVAPTFP